MQNQHFSMELPIQKAYSQEIDGVERIFISGIASGTKLDLHNEIMADSALNAMLDAIHKGVTLSNGKTSHLPLRSSHKGGWENKIGWLVDAELDAEKNLWVTAELDQDNANAMTLYKQLQRGDLPNKPIQHGLSIGGKITDYVREWHTEKSKFVRILKGMLLDEISVVEEPAYQYSFLEVIQKSLGDDIQENLMDNKNGEQTTIEVVMPESFTKSITDVLDAYKALTLKYDELMVQKQASLDEAAKVPSIEDIVQVQEEVVKAAVTAAVEAMKTDVVQPLVDEVNALKSRVEVVAAEPNDKSISVTKEKGDKDESPITKYRETVAKSKGNSIRAAIEAAGVSDTAKKIIS